MGPDPLAMGWERKKTMDSEQGFGPEQLGGWSCHSEKGEVGVQGKVGDNLGQVNVEKCSVILWNKALDLGD